MTPEDRARLREAQVKLTADYMNRVAVSLFAAGGISTILALFVDTGTLPSGVERNLWLVVVLSIGISLALHLIALRYLGRMIRAERRRRGRPALVIAGLVTISLGIGFVIYGASQVDGGVLGWLFSR